MCHDHKGVYFSKILTLNYCLVAEELNEKVQHGVYQCQNGPCYETIAEMRMAKSYGADALGMSTTYEGK